MSHQMTTATYILRVVKLSALNRQQYPRWKISRYDSSHLDNHLNLRGMQPRPKRNYGKEIMEFSLYLSVE